MNSALNTNPVKKIIYNGVKYRVGDLIKIKIPNEERYFADSINIFNTLESIAIVRIKELDGNGYEVSFLLENVGRGGHRQHNDSFWFRNKYVIGLCNET